MNNQASNKGLKIKTTKTTTKRPPLHKFDDGKACFDYKEEGECVDHVDGREGLRFGGFQIGREPCVWCCGEGCMGLGSNRCEPREWLVNQDGWVGQGISSHPEDECTPDFAQADEPSDEPATLDLESEVETDPRTGVTVPRFWAPPKDLDLDTHVHHLNGYPSIFLMIASYRDFQCHETVTSALERATHPGRVVIAAVEQRGEGDLSCDLPMNGTCEKNPAQQICKHKSRIKVYKMDYQMSSGPVYARHMGDRMYRGEAFRLQVDAHVQFVNRWDEMLIEQWNATKNEYAILSTYLTDLQESIDSKGNSLRITRPIMCNSDYEGPAGARYLRHGAQPERLPLLKEIPMLQPFWAAGMAFSRGHVATRVPYDCCAPQVFMGEEISMGVRAWTHGYDLYAPAKSVFFHEYASKSKRRHKVKLFFDNPHKRGNLKDSLTRITAIIGMNPTAIARDDWDKTEIDRYGIGFARPVDLFYKLIGVDVVGERVNIDLCKFVEMGLMHKSFTPYLRSNRRGIDYSGELARFDVRKALAADVTPSPR